MILKDSGERREFDSGAVRDIVDGKGRCDLMPLVHIGIIFNDPILVNIGSYIQNGSADCLADAIRNFVSSEYTDYQIAILELAKHYEDGAKKYGERNWEKGIPVHCYIDSAVRHYLKYKRGDKDEPHDRAFLWNLISACWTIAHKPEMDDIKPIREVNV